MAFKPVPLKSRWPLRIRTFLLFQPWFWTKPLILVTNLVQLWLFSVRFSDDGNLGLSSLVIFLRTPPHPPAISSSGAHFSSHRSGYWPWATSDCQPLTQMLLLTAIAFQKDESCISTIFSIMTYFERAHQKRARVWKKYGLWFLHECAHQITVPQALSPLLLNVPGRNPSIVVILWAPSDLGGSRKGREIRIFISKNKDTLPCICVNLLWMTSKKGPPMLGFAGS